MAKQTFLIFLLIATLTACTKAELAAVPTEAATPAATTIATQAPSVTPTPLPNNTATATNTPAPTNTPTATSTPTITPTATPVTPIWVEAGMPVPSSAVISPSNATQVTELARWGRGVIKDIDLSADGRWLAVAAGSGVYVHDVQNLSAEPRAIEADGNVTAVSISPTGNKVALAVNGREFQVWQVEPLRQLFIGGVANQLQFSPDGRVLSVVKQSSVELLNSSDGIVLASYEIKYAPRVKFSPSSFRVAIWSEVRKEVSIYDWQEDRLVDKWETTIHPKNDDYGEHFPEVGDVVFLSENDLRFLILENGAHVRMTGRIEVQNPGEGASFLFSVGAINYLAEPTKYVCNEPIFFYDPPEPPIPYHMEISPDKQISAVLYKDVGYEGDFAEHSSLRFYRNTDGQKLYNIEERIVDFELSPDGETWVAGSQDGRLQIRRLSDGTVLESVDEYDSPIQNATISSDNQWVGVVYLDEVKIFRREDGVLYYRYPASDIAFELDNKRFALAYQDGTSELRNIADGSLISAVRAHQDQVTTIRFLPSGDLLSAGLDCDLARWHVPDMSRLGSLENVMVEGYVTGNQVPMRVREFLVMPDGQTVIGLFLGGEFGVWSVEKGHLLRSPAWKDRTTILAASPDGRYLAVPAYEMPDSWNNEFTLLGSEGYVAGFSPDSRILADGLWRGGALQLWEIPSMTLLQTVTLRTELVTAVTFTPDSRLILTGALDGIVRLWGVP